MMRETVKILILEDLATDAELMQYELRRADLDFLAKTVETREEYLEAIQSFQPNLILADYNLPSFDGLEALAVLRQHSPDVPFIFVSGQLGEEVAIESLKQGATDYVLKNKLSRLGSAVERALLEVAERQDRQRAEEALRHSERRYRILVEQTPAVTYVAALDEKRSAIYASPQIETSLGFTPEEIRRNPDFWYRNLHPQDKQRVLEEMQDTLQFGKPFTSEYRIIGRSGREVWVRDEAVVLRDTEGNPTSLQGVMLDITPQKLAESALRDSERRFRLLFEFAPDPFYLCDLDGNLLDLNNAAREVFDINRNDFPGPNILSSGILDPIENTRFLESLSRSAAGEPTGAEEFKITRADGSQIILEISTFPIELEDERLVLGIGRDITERKQSEQIKKELLKRIVDAHEIERRRIARELHDSVNQILSSARFRLHSAAKKLPEGHQSLYNELQEGKNLLEESMREIRRISHNMRPSVLDDFGLAAAVETYCAEFRAMTNIDVRYDFAEVSKTISPEIDLGLYRIVQEAMHNVEKHSGATKVNLSLKRQSGWLTLTVQDNGKGFDLNQTEDKANRSSGLGLLHIQERAAFARGATSIESTPGKGTRVQVRIPIPQEEEK
ncbi:PAS domain S-box protein [bacterium]|nr:PAS domain S-box protein [bacterium]